MPLKRGVHTVIENAQLSRVISDQVRSKFPDAGTDAFGIGWEIERAKRTDFAISDQSFIGFNSDNCAVEDRN